MKKSLAMLLVLVLMLSLVSVAAFADKAVTLIMQGNEYRLGVREMYDVPHDGRSYKPSDEDK